MHERVLEDGKRVGAVPAVLCGRVGILVVRAEALVQELQERALELRGGLGALRLEDALERRQHALTRAPPALHGLFKLLQVQELEARERALVQAHERLVHLTRDWALAQREVERCGAERAQVERRGWRAGPRTQVQHGRARLERLELAEALVENVEPRAHGGHEV